MKKTMLLFAILFLMFVPCLVNAEGILKMSISCDKNTLNVGEEAICTVSGSSDAEGKVSLNKSGVTNVTLQVVTSGNYALGYVDKYSTSNGWYLSGQFNENVYNFTLNIANSNVASTEMFTFKVRANSRSQELKSTVSLQEVNVTMNGTTSKATVENGFEITVSADPNNKGTSEPNPKTGDNTLLMIAITGVMALSIGYISYRKFS
jgi:hypothetical protein